MFATINYNDNRQPARLPNLLIAVRWHGLLFDLESASPQVSGGPQVLDTELFGSVAAQMMNSTLVKLDSKSLPVRRTSGQHFMTVTFTANSTEF
jgi:hypothetical protein